jgi:hypothetical protein
LCFCALENSQRYLVVQVTKFCTVVPNIYSIITISLTHTLHTKMFISLHAPNRKQWITVRLADHCRILGSLYETFM